MADLQLIPDLEPIHAMGLVDLDGTALISAAIFFLVYLVVSNLLLKPYLGIVERREALTIGARTGAEEMVSRAKGALAEYESKLKAARSEAATLREAVRKDAQDTGAQAVKAARDQALAEVEAKRVEVRQAVAEAEKQLEPRARTLATVIVDRVLS